MKKVYESYTKVVAGSTYFFVKQFLVIAELPDLPPVLEKYGMHTDFDKACNIANLFDKEIKKQLLMELNNHEQLAKVIAIDNTNFVVKTVSGSK